MAIHDFIANGATLGQKILCMNARAKNSELLCEECPLEIQFNINIATVLDMELMESSFDLMTNPLFK
jgi:hypothetical protein